VKKEDLFKAIGDVDDAFLDENVTEIKHDTRWITAVLSLVACTALTAGLIHFVPKPARQPQEEIKVASSETTVTTVAETIPEFSDSQDTVFSETASCQVYISRMENYAEVNKNAPENLFDSIPFPELEIAVNAEDGYVSMLTVFDSNSLPRVGVLTRTDSDFTYLCQINGLEFTLEHPDAETLIFHCENHPLDGRTLTLCRDAVQPFADLSDDDIQEAVIWTAFEENQAHGFIGRKISDFADILRNMKLYYKTLAHESGDYYFTVTLKDGTSYEIQPTQSFLAVNGGLYYADEATRQALAEFYQNYTEEDIPESVPETTAPETSGTESQSTTSAESTVEGVILPYTTTQDRLSLEPQILPYTTTEGETQPQPQVLPYTKLQTETTTTTVTEAVTELSTEISEIPEGIQNIMYEDEASGIIFSHIQPENETHIEIAVENGCYLESNLSNAIRYYPEKKYAVSMQVFSHLLLQDIEEELAGKGIEILGHRESDGRILAIVTEEQLNLLNQTETMGFLIDLVSQS